ncbi:MAG TPA: hypothetical protein PLQ81_04635, partial [bacterium]|nr:hypothetical protein [bacterium]
MANILIITTELTSLKGLPTGGRGVRVQNLADGLKSHNHNVIMSFLNDSISRIETIGKISVPEEFKKYGHNYCYDKIISKVRPDIIIFSPWMLAISYDAKKFKTIPVVLDMPGMITLENIYDKMENDFDFLAKKIHTFNKSDLFCVSNQRQKYYLYSLLLMSGIDINEKSVILSPISYTDNIPEHKKYPSPPTYIFSGVLWNWQNYGDSLSNIAGYLAKNGGEFEIYCGNFLYAETSRSLNELKRFESVKLNGLIEHDALLQKYIQSSVAVELYLPNPERELATTTRTLEYIWSGLPVIYSKGMYLAEFIKEYDAGWVIDPLDSDELLKVLNEINL